MHLQNVHVPPHAIVSFVLDVVGVLGVAAIVVSPAVHLGGFEGAHVFSLKLFVVAVSASFAAFVMGLYQREFWGWRKLPPRLAIALAMSVIVAGGLSRIGTLSGNVWTEILLVNILVFALILLNRLICSLIGEKMKTPVLYFGSESGLAALRKIERLRKLRTFSIDHEFSSAAVHDEGQLNALFGAVNTSGAGAIVVGGTEETMNRFATAFLSWRHVDVSVMPLSAFIENETRRLDIYDPEAARQLTFYRTRRTGISRVAKRVGDILFALAFLVFTLPVTALTCLLILILEGRPIFYHQERVGLGGRVFTLYKFRSMTVNAEADGIARWTTPSDSRVTSVGRILRFSRIDEIPQLFNVLRGDMSLVGPRPERPSIVSDLQEKIPLYASRHSVPSGITGWAQINFPYGASVEDAVAKTGYDLYYVKNASLLLDVVILLQTVRVILLGEGSR